MTDKAFIVSFKTGEAQLVRAASFFNDKGFVVFVDKDGDNIHAFPDYLLHSVTKSDS